MLVPVTSTYWPGTKCAAVISAPIATSASSETRNSAIFAFGSTFAAAKWPRCGLVTFLTLAAPTPSCSAVYPSLSCVRCATTWQLSTRSTVTATWLPSSVKTRLMPSFFAIRPVLIAAPYSLISTSTPAARSSFISASTVCGVGSTISSSRLCVRISNCSRLFLSTCGDRLTVNFSILVGSGIGPRTCAPVRFAVLTISRVDVSRMRWSKALSRMRMFWPFISISLPASCRAEPAISKRRGWPGMSPAMTQRLLLDDARDDAGADGAATLADREAQFLFHRDRHDQVHFHRDVVARHHHFGALGQMHHPGHVGGAEVELRAVVGEERRVASALLLGEDVRLGLELGVRLH